MNTIPAHMAAFGVTQEMYDALIKVQNMLAEGKIKQSYEDKWDIKPGFNMNRWIYIIDPRRCYHNVEEEEKAANFCNSIFCIGGSMQMILGYNPEHKTGYFHPLFFPNADPNFCCAKDERNFELIHDMMEKITPEMAVEAIDNFIRNGEPCWIEVYNKHIAEKKHV